MYFPYLRGRQFELIALRELLENNLIGEKVIPVIEPIKPTSTLAHTLTCFIEKKQQHAMVMNPGVGNFITSLQEKKAAGDKIVAQISKDLKSDSLIKAYLMKKSTPALLAKKENLENLMIINPKRDCMESFLKVYSSFEPRFTLLPDDRTFCRKAPKSKVLFEDHFPKAQKNSEYSKNVDEFFSEDHLYYESEGFQGFSDYSVVGSDFNETGFAPLAIAIHIVYFDEERVLRIHHFVSDSNTDYNDPAGKFGEAVKKLVIWTETYHPDHTVGLDMLIDCYRSKRYPGLGTIKKYSIMHHIELMSRFLQGEL